MSSKQPAPQPSPETIDVDAAFNPEKRHAQAEMDVYEENRPGLNEAGAAVAPDGSELKPPKGMDLEDATQEEINKAAADAYFDGQRKVAKDHSQISYEDMSVTALAHKLGEAEHNGDKTTEDSVTEVLLEKMGEEETRIAANEDGTETEARQDNLWDSVIAAKDLKKRQLKKKDGTGNSQTTENGNEPSDNPDAPYDWDANGAFEPFVEEEPESTEEADPATAQEEEQNLETGSMRLIVGRAEQAEHGEDSILDRRDLKLFGVADGMGGMTNGAEASKLAVEAIEELYDERSSEDEPSTPAEAMEFAMLALGTARQKVSEITGFTTAIFGKVEHIDGEDVLVWAGAGDSRLYLQRDHDDEIEQISEDQVAADGTTLLNGLTPRRVKDDESQETRYVPFEDPTIMDLDEIGFIKLSDSDRVMFCTDGITGDYNPQRPDRNWQVMKPEELEDAFDMAAAQDVANRLLELSRKPDDKSVLVIDAFSKDED
jgi:serine/threonine protein phosphatase PrpC